MNPFIKIIESISYRHSANEVFNDWLFMSVCAFAMGRMEKQYLEVARRYNKEELVLFSQALAAFMIEGEKQITTDGGWNDLLGEYFMEINSKSTASDRGQFFTPVEVCQMMAQITAKDNSGETIADPTCGSSRCLIAHSRTKPNNRLNCFYYGMDLDSRCVNMSVLNFVMFGMKGVVIHMDTLANKIYGGYRIFLPETGLFVKPLTVNECAQYLYTEKSFDNGDLKKVAEIMLSEPMSKKETELWKKAAV